MIFDDELARYLEFVYLQTDTNWNLSVEQGRYKSIVKKAVECSLENFNMNSKDLDDKSLSEVQLRKSLYKAWDGILIMCPENVADDSLYLSGV